jgi:hypothetical protein
MAYRKYVIASRKHTWIAAALLSFVTCACSDAGPTVTDHRGRVIDVETGQGIAGAIVVAKYMGSRGFEGASSCNRVESAVSDQDGWFDLPDDARAGPRLMEAYHPNYVPGYRARYAVGISEHEWQVWAQKRDDNDKVVSINEESQVYPSKVAAQAVSREWIDLYMKRFRGTREQRLSELDRLVVQGVCVAGPRTTEGALSFARAILYEQRALSASEGSLKQSADILKYAEVDALRRSKQ